MSLAKELLQLPGVGFLLSGKFDQDPQEEDFSKIRSAGGRWDNPTVESYGDLAMGILVGGDCVRGSMKANSKPQEVSDELQAILPKPNKRAKLSYDVL